MLGFERQLLSLTALCAAVVGGACGNGGGGVSDAGRDRPASGSGGARSSGDADVGTGGRGGAGAGGSPGMGGVPGTGGATTGVGGSSGVGSGVGGAGGADPNAWANWPMPNPIATALPNPQSYDTSNPDLVLDRVTGLMWERTIDPTSGRLWVDAAAYCDGLSLGGHDDWRMPTLIELVSLVDFTQQSPSIDPVAFPATPADSFWTSSPVVGSPGELWYVQFTTGFNYPGHSDFLPIKVRCVR